VDETDLQGRKPVKSRNLVWMLCALICVSLPLTTFFAFSNRSAFDSTASLINSVGDSLLAIVFTIPAAYILSHYPRHAIGWLLMIPACAIAVSGPITGYFSFHVNPSPTPFILLMSWFSGWSWVLLIFPFINIPLLFPTGKPLSPRWRWVSIISVIWAGLFIFGATFIETLGAIIGNSYQNPFGFIPDQLFVSWLRIWIPGLLLLTLLSMAALILRHRRSSRLERTQINWLLFACLFFTINYLLIGILNIEDSETIVGYIAELIFSFSLMLVPVSIAIAILRYRLWDIKILIRRTLVYSILSAILALVYFGGVTLFQGLFSKFTGDQSSAAIVLSTLSIAALFNPLHNRIRSFIDRRFYRSKYDSEKTLLAFSQVLREEVDLDELNERLVAVVNETLQPERVGLWIRNKTRI